MPYATLISTLIAFTALIPMIGAFIGTAVGALLILMVDPIKALWFIVFIIVLQQFESNLIYPRVVGKSIGLPGIWVPDRRYNRGQPVRHIGYSALCAAVFSDLHAAEQCD